MWTQKEVGQADEEWRIRDLSEEEFGGRSLNRGTHYAPVTNKGRAPRLSPVSTLLRVVYFQVFPDPFCDLVHRELVLCDVDQKGALLVFGRYDPPTVRG